MSELALGQTVQLLSDGRHGVVRFIGETSFSAGVWVGVELEDDSGKNDGSVRGERYFDCPMGYGMFVRPLAVTIIEREPPPPRPPSARPTPVPPPAAKPAAAAAVGGGPKKSARPNSMFASSSASASSGRGGGVDSSLNKRRSINTASPSPAPRSSSRPSSTIARSPTKSPTKQLSTAASSASTSRTGTPANSRPMAGGAGGGKPRPSLGIGGGNRTSMGPPPLPGTGGRPGRQSSVSSNSSATGRNAMNASAGPSSVGNRIASARMALTGRMGGGGGGGGLSSSSSTRPDGFRNVSAPPQAGAAGSGGGRGGMFPRKGSSSDYGDNDDHGYNNNSNINDKILSPQPTSPVVQAKTRALEKMTGTVSPPQPSSSKPAASGASSSRSAGGGGGIGGGSSSSSSNKEVEDLKAKLRVLEKKRIEDREKLQQLQKLQSERDKFERIIQTLQIKYQPQQEENTELRRKLKEAETRLESVEALQAEHESAMELATLDREMAEETAEVLKVELDALRQKSEELELEVDILREENAEFSKGMTAEERASTGWLQMERNNERLREALIRLRDLTQQQEEELRAQIGALEEDVRELEAVRAAHEQARAGLAQAEAAVEDLRQQLDTALGAEDMIEELTERNMSQQEQIEELRATVEDLQSLKELADELEVNHVENEKEMQEEIDHRDALLTEQARRAALQDEALEDMEYTLSRFRELVTSLQGDLEDMRASHAVSEVESEQLASRSRAMLDLNRKLQLSASKAQAKAIDLELRRLDAREAEQHLDMVSLFLPEAYRPVRDSVLALLRFRRLAFKANLLASFVKERAASGGNVNGAAAGTEASGGGGGGGPHAGHEDDVFWACDVVDRLTWVAAMCDRFERAMAHCSPAQFARYEGALYELEPVERALNGWIDGLRRDDLREKQCATDLQRTMAVMAHLGEVHMGSAADINNSINNNGADSNNNNNNDGATTTSATTTVVPDLEGVADEMHMRALLMQSHLESAAVTFATTKAMVQRVVSSRRSGVVTVSGSGNNNSDEHGSSGDSNGDGVAVADGVAAADGKNGSSSGDVNNNITTTTTTNSDDDELAMYFSKRVDALVSQTRSTKVVAGKVVRALEELRARSLALTPDTAPAFEQCAAATRELAEMARQTGLDLHQMLHDEGRTNPPTHAEVAARVHQTALVSFSSSEADLFSTYLNRLRVVSAQMADLAAASADLAQTQEFEHGAAPWVTRSQELRALRSVPADAEEELRRLKEEHHEARRRAARRDEELSEAELKIATLEARMRDARAKAELMAALEARLAAATQDLAALADDMAKRDRELKALEADRDKWKKIASDGRALAGVALAGGGADGDEDYDYDFEEGGEEDAAGTSAADAERQKRRRRRAGDAGFRAGQERAVMATAREMDALRDEIAGLQAALRYLREDSRRARLAEQHKHDWLAASLVPSSSQNGSASAAVAVVEQRQALVAAEARDVLGELVRLAAGAEVYKLKERTAENKEDRLRWRPARTTPAYHAARQQEDLAAWKGWQDAVVQKARLLASPAAAVAAVRSGGTAGGGGGERKQRSAAVARLQIRLPGADGKSVPALGMGMGGKVQIVGSREWEGLQGRLAAAVV